MIWKKTRWLDWREFQVVQREHDFFKTINEEAELTCKNPIWR